MDANLCLTNLLSNQSQNPLGFFQINFCNNLCGCNIIDILKKKMKKVTTVVSAFSYQKFVNFALEETFNHTRLESLNLQDFPSSMMALDGESELRLLAFKAPKIRLLRSLCVEGGEALQVLDFTVFPEPRFDFPIFCANFFANANINIIVLDLNPLHDVIFEKEYKEKYYKNIMPLGTKYSEALPWGGKITSESLKFFSPIVIWTKFSPSQQKHTLLYNAFVDYYKTWLCMMEKAEEMEKASHVDRNLEAQHRYLTWRAEKDPGYSMLRKLIGEIRAREMVRYFLFNGVDDLGHKSFLDYFPEYRCEDGSVNSNRSVAGKLFQTRPWDANGDFRGFFQ